MHAGKGAKVGVVQEIECLSVELQSILFSGRAWERRWRGAIAAADANHPHLRTGSRLLLGTEIHSPTQTRSNLPSRSAASAITSDAHGPIVDDGVAVVIKTGSDVVGQR